MLVGVVGSIHTLASSCASSVACIDHVIFAGEYRTSACPASFQASLGVCFLLLSYAAYELWQRPRVCRSCFKCRRCFMATTSAYPRTRLPERLWPFEKAAHVTRTCRCGRRPGTLSYKLLISSLPLRFWQRCCARPSVPPSCTSPMAPRRPPWAGCTYRQTSGPRIL
jgi:hypothetical protein